MQNTMTRRRLLGGLLASITAAIVALPTDAEARSRGCGSRGGPGGKRDKNGKCPSWKKRRP